MKTCEAPDCANEFEPKRSTARFCSATCRQRAGRARKAAAAEAADVPEPEDGFAEHGLVKAIRRELAEAGKLETFKGQLALQLARRMANPEESSPAALAKALENAMAAALGDSPEPTPPTPAAPADPDDEIRKRRDAKRQAAREASS